MSMQHSLEARVPFLDRSMLELSRRMPSRLRLRGLTTKYLLRRAMAERLPPAVLNGKKRGFNVPMPAWLAGGLRDFTRDVAVAGARAPPGPLPAGRGRATGGRASRAVGIDHSRAIWTLLVLSVWQDELLRDVPPGPERVAAASL